MLGIMLTTLRDKLLETITIYTHTYLLLQPLFVTFWIKIIHSIMYEKRVTNPE
jgi:hypothetical protein